MVQRREKGFTLLELMVVCAIIITLAAVMLPAVISSIQTSNETSVANVMRQVAQAETSYSQLFPVIGFSTTAPSLGGPISPTGCPNVPKEDGSAACLLPDSQAIQLQSGQMYGYQFAYTSAQDATGRNSSFVLQAAPSSSVSGRKAFVVDQSGVIWYALTNGQTGSAAFITPGNGNAKVLGQ